MNGISNLTVMVGILLISLITPASAQRFMKMDNNLKRNSTPLKKKQMRFISSAYKYQFGNYQVISHKQEWDWGWGSNKSRIHSALEIDSLKTRSKHSLVFVNAGIDTVVINTSVNEYTVFADKASFFNRFFFGSHDIDLVESKGSFIATFKSVSDTSVWELMLIYPVVVEMDGNMVADQTTPFKGLLTDGSILIEIVKIIEPEMGEVSIWKPVEGYEFFMDHKSICAVQTIPQNAQYVWMQEDLDDRLSIVVATAAASIYQWMVGYQINWQEHLDAGF
jgi:hypothetical protein